MLKKLKYRAHYASQLSKFPKVFSQFIRSLSIQISNDISILILTMQPQTTGCLLCVRIICQDLSQGFIFPGRKLQGKQTFYELILLYEFLLTKHIKIDCTYKILVSIITSSLKGKCMKAIINWKIQLYYFQTLCQSSKSSVSLAIPL